MLGFHTCIKHAQVSMWSYVTVQWTLWSMEILRFLVSRMNRLCLSNPKFLRVHHTFKYIRHLIKCHMVKHIVYKSSSIMCINPSPHGNHSTCRPLGGPYLWVDPLLVGWVKHGFGTGRVYTMAIVI